MSSLKIATNRLRDLQSMFGDDNTWFIPGLIDAKYDERIERIWMYILSMNLHQETLDVALFTRQGLNIVFEFKVVRARSMVEHKFITGDVHLLLYLGGDAVLAGHVGLDGRKNRYPGGFEVLIILCNERSDTQSVDGRCQAG